MPQLSQSLPADLEDLATSRFDELHGKGRILYEPTTPEYLTHNGFDLEIRICPFLKSKPIKGPEDDERNKAQGPFVDPKPDEVLHILGKSHRVMLNTFCMFRPMLLVTTYEFQLQEDPLTKEDLEALWTTLKAMITPQVGFYNCGVYSGSSQGHKHMQLFPKPDESVFKLFPSRAMSTEDITSNIDHVPFQHFVLRLPKDAVVDDVCSRYIRLLDRTKEALKEAGEGTDHNVVMTTEWIALIPRSVQEWGGPWGSNSMGMIGMISIRDDEERAQWTKLGYSNYLRQLGLPRS